MEALTFPQVAYITYGITTIEFNRSNNQGPNAPEHRLTGAVSDET
jgi:hypothetical protein